MGISKFIGSNYKLVLASSSQEYLQTYLAIEYGDLLVTVGNGGNIGNNGIIPSVIGLDLLKNIGNGGDAVPYDINNLPAVVRSTNTLFDNGTFLENNETVIYNISTLY